MATCLGGANFVLHTAGWLEGGLSVGYEKFVMDCDQAGMMHAFLAGVDGFDRPRPLPHPHNPIMPTHPIHSLLKSPPIIPHHQPHPREM